MKIEFPRHMVNYNCILPIIRQLEPMFKANKKLLPVVEFDLFKMRKISILGTLILYKLLDHSYRNQCFKEHQFGGDKKFLESVFQIYGFTELFKSYFGNNMPNDNISRYIKIRTQPNFIIAPQSLSRTNFADYNNHLQKTFVPALNRFYSSNPDAVSMMLTCISEIMANYWQHATDKYNSLLVAEGSKDIIEISCIDTGIGIVSSMESSKLFKVGLSKEKLLNKALTKGVSSKPNTNHMGYGLWIIDEIVSRTKGVLHIYTQGVYYKNERGQKWTEKGGFWNGTILYLQLPLSNPVTHSQLFSTKETNSLAPKINFV